MSLDEFLTTMTARGYNHLELYEFEGYSGPHEAGYCTGWRACATDRDPFDLEFHRSCDAEGATPQAVLESLIVNIQKGAH